MRWHSVTGKGWQEGCSEGSGHGDRAEFCWHQQPHNSRLYWCVRTPKAPRTDPTPNVQELFSYLFYGCLFKEYFWSDEDALLLQGIPSANEDSFPWLFRGWVFFSLNQLRAERDTDQEGKTCPQPKGTSSKHGPEPRAGRRKKQLPCACHR